MAILVIIQSRSRRHIYAKSCARYNLKFVKMELEKSLPGKAETTFVQNSEEDEEQEEEEEEEGHRDEDQKLIKEIMDVIYAAEGEKEEKGRRKSENEAEEEEEEGEDETIEASREESGGSWEEISTSL